MIAQACDIRTALVPRASPPKEEKMLQQGQHFGGAGSARRQLSAGGVHRTTTDGRFCMHRIANRACISAGAQRIMVCNI